MSYSNLPAPGAGGPSKLPIPRLHKHRSEPPRKAIVSRQNRVSRACLSCRSRKIKCNGLQPRCSNCSENSSPCVYASSRKDRLKTATSHNQDMIAMLRALRSQVSAERQARIDDLLAGVAEDIADAAATVGDPIDKYRGPIEDEDRGEIGSPGEQDALEEDFVRTGETKAAGFIGEASEIQWLRSLYGTDASNTDEGGSWGQRSDNDAAVDGRLEAHRRRRSGKATPALVSASKTSFYLDDEMFESDLLVDPLEMPPFETAENLIKAYMQSTQNAFPFLSEKTFISRFSHYYASLQRGTPYKVARKWQAQLNLVFAIGAVYSHLSKAEWQADERDHLVYHSRAWSLSSQNPWGFSYPDLVHMQITGLLSFYYLSIGHINRSWILIGNALRSGYALGMHLRNEDRTTSATRKEINYRIWWAHHSLERLVSTLTGRPSLAVGYVCSVPLPLPLEYEDVQKSIIDSRFGDIGEQPVMPRGTARGSRATDFSAQQDDAASAHSGSYLGSRVRLDKIIQAALDLYGPNTVTEPWEHVQRTIAHLNDKLDAWATALPEGFNFSHRSTAVEDRYRREQNALHMMYQSTKILITRPCLCRTDLREQATNSDNFNRRAALICVEAAQSIASFLPAATSDNIVKLYESGPWWQMVHVIMQALVVLCLEIVLQAMHISEDRQGLVSSLKKLLQWLRIMRVNNNMAIRAYAISVGLLKKLMSTSNINVRDLLSEDEAMVGYNESTAPAQTHTPYPNVLNPVDEPPIRKPSSGTPTTAPYQSPRTQQKQQHNASCEATHRSSYPSASSQNHSLRSRLPTEPLHLPPVYADNDSEISVDAYTGLFLASSGLEQTILPGWVYTSFDNSTLWAGLGLHATSSEVR